MYPYVPATALRLQVAAIVSLTIVSALRSGERSCSLYIAGQVLGPVFSASLVGISRHPPGVQ